MKLLQAAFIVTIIVAAFVCVGFASALNQDEASIHNVFSPSVIIPGQTVSATIFFTSNTTDILQITRVGYNFDWMSPENYVGADLTSSPVTVAGGSTQSIGQITIPIPANVTLGTHTYTIVIDGIQGSAATEFTWTSPTLSVETIGSSGQTAGPTVTTAPTGGDSPGGQPDLQLYGAVIAVIVIVVLLMIVLLLRRRKPKPQPAKEQAVDQMEEPKPEQKPEPKPEQQDFDI